MRVLFLIDSLGTGGAERSTVVMLPYLRERGVACSVIILAEVSGGSEDELRSAGFQVRSLRSQRFGGRVKELRRVINTERPDILHTALFTSDQIGRVAAIGTQSKLISSLVSTPRTATRQWGVGPAPWKIRVVNACDMFTSQLLTDRFHAVSPGVATTYSAKYRLARNRITVVERGRQAADLGQRNVGRRSIVRRDLDIDARTEVVLAAGRHFFQKAHVDLIRAISILVSSRPDILLLVAGREGEATSEMIAEIAATPGLTDHVRLLGYRTDVADLLAASDVMALSSRFEGTAGVALEAMAVGTPIVSTHLEGLDGILIDGHNALVVPIGDPPAMAASIARLLDNRELAARLAEAGRKDFLDRFTIERAADGMVAMYRDVVAS